MTPRPDVLLLVLLLAGGMMAAAPRAGSNPTDSAAEKAGRTPAGWVQLGAPSVTSTGYRAKVESVGAPLMRAAVLDGLLAAARTPITVASWYVDPRKRGLYAATPEFRWGMAPYRLRVCRADRPAVCVAVTVSDACYCRVGRSVRAVDLSRTAFSRLAAPAVGLVRVIVRRVP